MVEIAVSRGGELEGAEADFVKRFVVNAESLIRVFNELVDGQCRVVWLNIVGLEGEGMRASCN